MQNDHFSRHAQQVLTVTRGQDPLHGPGSDPSIARSWLRCLEDYHLDPALTIAPTVLEHGRLLESRERLQQVLSIAGNEMNSLHQQLSGAGHAVLLTDARGVILNCVTAPSERKIFEGAGLWLGADWSEACEGTNGIGTCLVERQSLTIHRDEHFRGRHTGLTCSASPVFDPHGELLAVLDVSSAREAVSRQSQFHTMALVNLSAKMIESCYFLRHFEHHWLLRFHLQAESVGLFSEGLLAFDGEGRICAVNQSALNLLGQIRGGLLGQPVEAFFDCSLDELLGRASANASASWPLRTRDGRGLFAVLRGQPRSVPVPVAHALQERPRLPGICLGDAALQNDFRRALRVFEHRLVVPIGGEPQAVDVRIISATHRNLLDRVQDGSFREDLYYRLNGLEVALPPLRERSDKLQLLDFLLAEEAGDQAVQLDGEARQALLAFAWPGNVRQLRTVLRTLAALCEDGRVRLDDLPAQIRAVQTVPVAVSEPANSLLDAAERQALLATLVQQRWHMTHVATVLGVSRNTLYRKLRKYGIARQV
eukprot:gene1279-1472_t